MGKKSNVAVALLGAAATFIVSGCAAATGAQVVPDSSIKAQLDYEQAIIRMPLDAYIFGDAYHELVNRAVEVGVGPCMRSAGFEYHAASLASGSVNPTISSRQFGIWSVASAKLLGLGIPNDPANDAEQSDAARYGAAWKDAEQRCRANVSDTVFTLGPTDEEIRGKAATRLEAESYALASATDHWKQAKTAWGSCLTAAGLTPRTGDREWTSAESLALITSSGYVNSPPSAESIRLGVIEATCNTNTRMAEQMANTQAAYEGALMHANEAALTEEKNAVQKATITLEQYMARQQT